MAAMAAQMSNENASSAHSAAEEGGELRQGSRSSRGTMPRRRGRRLESTPESGPDSTPEPLHLSHFPQKDVVCLLLVYYYI